MFYNIKDFLLRNLLIIFFNINFFNNSPFNSFFENYLIYLIFDKANKLYYALFINIYKKIM